MDESIESTKRQLLLGTLLLLLIVGFGIALFFDRVISKPVRLLNAGTERVASGDLETLIKVETEDEIGQLADAFNRMTGDLRVARTELTSWSEQLEQRVVEKSAELYRVQQQAIHMERMASLGKLAATVAHEINNPLAGIVTYAKLIERQVREDLPTYPRKDELNRYAKIVQEESLRCGTIVRNLLAFSRQSGGALEVSHLNEIVERSLMLVQHRLDLASIELETQLLDGDDEILCDAADVQQALMALMINAIEAMDGQDSGTLRVSLYAADNEIGIDISDTGVGIAEATAHEIFEPFYSTKGERGGVGLGLTVVYGVMQRHGYRIDVDSAPNVGTVFHLRLSRQPSTGPQLDASR